MKKIFTILFLAFNLVASATSILIRPDGSGNAVLEQMGYSTGAHYWPGSAYNPGWYSKTDMTGIDTVFIRDTSNWNKLEVFGLKGTAGHRIVVRMENDARVTFKECIKTFDCEYIKWDFLPLGFTPFYRPPTNAEASQFRFYVHNPDPAARSIAFEIVGRQKSIDVLGIDAQQVGYLIQAKTDPQCDVAYNRPGWIMDSIRLFYFRCYDVWQDIIYWGNSSHMLRADDNTNGRYILCDTLNDGGALDTCQSPNYLPMKMGNSEVAYGAIGSAGRQGLVIGGNYYGTNKFHDIRMRDLGYQLDQGQGEGVGNGGLNKNVHIYNMDIKWTFLYGCADFGQDSYIYDNVFDSTGFLRKDSAVLLPNSGGFAPFLRNNADLDSLDAARADIEKITANTIKNVDAGGVYGISSTTKITWPTDEPKTTRIYSNRFGVNSRSDGIELAFQDYGPATNWTTNSVVCENTMLDGTTPINIARFTYLGNPWPTYSTDCSPFDAPFRKHGNNIHRYIH